ncbi:anti-sigma factor RsiW [Actinoplanes octamycinicus]|uniref:Anti-sigma factor RsiW n=1 Tax=Actinoplanes octamycinicus TaxID=135948 RepID=A0A7W7H1E7_9ACTN|nr:zf-HC2 domain-containing protein [Actinoplanes octamycinicus]MBB4742205.1 anti-sigma factor RsiW [Actinoplanes octamycinicus]GIE59949.1 anti-sigma factor [Actinoplanes octamycinicus]
MNCDEFVELVTAYLDGALEPAVEQRFAEHLTECDGCDRYLEQIRTTVAALGQLPEQGLAADARDRLLAAFRDWPAG